MITLDIDQCAEFLKINKTTASEMAADGILPGAKVGRAWVFLKDDLIQYLRETVQKQQQERLKNNKPKVTILEDIMATVASKQKSKRNAIPVLP